MEIIYHTIFLLITGFILIKTIFYGLYEINTLKNKVGGIVVICFSIIVIIFTNLIVFLR